MSALLEPGAETPPGGISNEGLLALSTAHLVVGPVRNPHVLVQMGGSNSFPPSDEATNEALRELVARFRDPVAGLLGALNRHRPDYAPALMADGLITIAAVTVLNEERPFVERLREDVRTELLAQAPAATDAWVAYAQNAMRSSIARATLIARTWLPVQQLILLLHARPRNGAEPLTVEDGYLSTGQLAVLLGKTAASVGQISSSLTSALRTTASLGDPTN